MLTKVILMVPTVCLALRHDFQSIRPVARSQCRDGDQWSGPVAGPIMTAQRKGQRLQHVIQNNTGTHRTTTQPRATAAGWMVPRYGHPHTQASSLTSSFLLDDVATP